MADDVFQHAVRQPLDPGPEDEHTNNIKEGQEDEDTKEIKEQAKSQDIYTNISSYGKTSTSTNVEPTETRNNERNSKEQTNSTGSIVMEPNNLTSVNSTVQGTSNQLQGFNPDCNSSTARHSRIDNQLLTPSTPNISNTST
jgi:hypothetical protein